MMNQTRLICDYLSAIDEAASAQRLTIPRGKKDLNQNHIDAARKVGMAIAYGRVLGLTPHATNYRLTALNGSL